MQGTAVQGRVRQGNASQLGPAPGHREVQFEVTVAQGDTRQGKARRVKARQMKASQGKTRQGKQVKVSQGRQRRV